MARIRKTSSTREASSQEIIWQIALYIRLSKDDGSDESLSVTNQRKILTEYVEKSFQAPYSIAGIYVDDGVSGTDYERPEFQHMVHDVETGKVNCIICKNLSRAFRNYSDQGYFLENFFSLHKTRFITLSDPQIDTYLFPEAVSGMEVPINGLMNDRYAYKTSSDVRRTFNTKRRNGEFIGAFAPFGYQKKIDDKNSLIVDPEAAQIVRDIFRWYVIDGMSKGGIARKLNELGIPNPSAYKKSKGLKYCNQNSNNNDGLWVGSSISTILKNKVYIGTMVQGKQKVISYKVHNKVPVSENEWFEVENMQESIIDNTLFAAAQTLMEKETRVAPGKKANYLFSGLLKCADCGKSMTRRGAKGYIYYSCSTYKRKSRNLCTKHSIRLDVLEAAVLMAIQQQIDLLSYHENLIKEINRTPANNKRPARLELLIKCHQQEIAKTEAILKELYFDWKNGDITREQYLNMKNDLETKIKRLSLAATHLTNDLKGMGEGLSSTNPFLLYFLEHKNIDRLTQGLLTALVDSIYIHEHGELTIKFKFEDPYQVVLTHTARYDTKNRECCPD